MLAFCAIESWFRGLVTQKQCQIFQGEEGDLLTGIQVCRSGGCAKTAFLFPQSRQNDALSTPGTVSASLRSRRSPGRAEGIHLAPGWKINLPLSRGRRNCRGLDTYGLLPDNGLEVRVRQRMGIEFARGTDTGTLGYLWSAEGG